MFGASSHVLTKQQIIEKVLKFWEDSYIPERTKGRFLKGVKDWLLKPGNLESNLYVDEVPIGALLEIVMEAGEPCGCSATGVFIGNKLATVFYNSAVTGKNFVYLKDGYDIS